ncbi:Glycosyltransferase [Methanosarcina sp. Kolksee]|uniref:glycosyltransferase family 4 protein n=1 Tax=Methanosarcina sp. Kolksee TaxID=1434099 RepID=UPI000615D648|nr:glycosyltransferase family 1 protein [Methanosarcina sp. Kolksee]AKB46557.1 Glycosyltransferase [Methanosarcina sp. Kolksee]
MKVGIISESLGRRTTGVGTYTFNLIKEVSQICPKESISLIDYADHEGFNHLNKSIVGPFVNSFPKKSYIWNLYLQLKLRSNDLDIDIIHSPENASLFTKLQDQKKVITAHDNMAYSFPIYSMTGIRYKYLFPKALKTSDKIIAVSNSVKKNLIQVYNLPEDKIKVVYEAADKSFKPLNNKLVENIKQKYNIYFPFILYVGSLEVKKNIPSLITAFYMIKKKNISHKLVITAQKNTQNFNNIFKKVVELNLVKEVVFIGKVPKEYLPYLYNAADLFVFPSLYEGFGLPPLEAMACGTPVITSNTYSLPEVVGNAGVMVNPYDIHTLANMMYIILTNNEVRQDLCEKGIKRAKMFSWEKCARETLQVYEEVYDS